MAGEHLLPPNASDLERTLSATISRLSDVPTPIEITKRPYEAPAAFLPFLAWELSVDIWSNSWPEARKRAVTAAAIPLHRKKGTAYAIREYVRHADGEVLEITRPPQKVFSGPSLTRAEREAWLSDLPQLRAWRMREAGIAPAAKAFHGSSWRPSFAEGTFATPSTAIERLRRRARWVVAGVETEIRVSEFGSYWRVHLPGSAAQSVFSGRPIGKRFYRPSSARRRLVTIQPTPRLPWRSAVGPSLEPVTAEPERIKVGGHRGRSVFSGAPCGNAFFARTTAPFRIFERHAVHDGRRVGRRSPVQFMGQGRYGFPKHTAHMKVSIPGRRSRFAAGDGIITARTRFWTTSDAAARVERVCRAIQSAKRLSDTILIKIGPSARFVAGTPFIAGVDRFVVGQP